MFQSVPLLGRVATETGGITIGTGILLLPLLNRLEVAENAATLGAIRDGPFVLGVGFDNRDVENAAFGVTGSRVGTFDAKLDVVRRLLAGELVTATGSGYALQDAQLALRPERTPAIWMAANGDRAVTRGARQADAWLINPRTHLDEVALYRAERVRAGLPPVSHRPIVQEVCVAETDEAAVATARPFLEGKSTRTSRGGRARGCPRATRCGASRRADRGWPLRDRLAGHVCPRARRARSASSVDHVVWCTQWPACPGSTCCARYCRWPATSWPG